MGYSGFMRDGVYGKSLIESLDFLGSFTLSLCGNQVTVQVVVAVITSHST